MKQTLLEIPFQPPEQVFIAFAAQPGSLFFDSSAPHHPLSRYSFIAFEPLEIIESLDDIPDWFASYEPLAKPPVPFTGGAAGFFSYDAPALKLGIYDQVLAFDLLEQRAWYCSYSDTQADAQLRWNSLAKRIASAPPLPNADPATFTPVKSCASYEADIQKVIDYIYAGDIFQANLAQRFVAPYTGNAYAHYLKLRRVNPAPFSAFLNFGAVVISSSSPERFLNVQGRQVETRPIKGTHKDADTLRTSAKDRAENIMIVDLLRNDLSKVCADDSIAVPQLCEIESYAGLHHLVSVVTGTLRHDKKALDALLACFPGGSITGAPKLRAMEIIVELEPFKRGPYCGAIGYLGFNGTMDMNIAIRTLVFENGRAVLHAGGGITAHSTPAAEYDETLLKAQKIFESFT